MEQEDKLLPRKIRAQQITKQYPVSSIHDPGKTGDSIPISFLIPEECGFQSSVTDYRRDIQGRRQDLRFSPHEGIIGEQGVSGKKGRAMTTVKLELPERIAKEAQSAGLLEPERLAHVLEEALRREAAEEFFAYSEKLRKAGAPTMSEDEVMAEVKAARENRRNQAGR